MEQQAIRKEQEMAITLEEAKGHMRIDYDDENAYIESLIEVSLIYIDSMVGDFYKSDENALKLSNLLQLKLIEDMFSNRGTKVNNNVTTDIIITSILDKLSNYTE